MKNNVNKKRNKWINVVKVEKAQMKKMMKWKVTKIKRKMKK